MSALGVKLQESVEKLRSVVSGDNSSGLIPLGHAVLVRPYEPERHAGMIQIPEQVRLNMQAVDQRAVVVAVGPEAWKGQAAWAKPGDRVLVTKHAGYIAGEGQTQDKQTYRLVQDRDIFCRIDWSEK